jgi:hypothetical protein
MLETITAFFAGEYAPHGYCLLWHPGLIWTHVISDALIAAAYFSIPIALVTFVRRRPDVEFGGMFWLFALFILSCGMTHVMGMWNLWNGDHRSRFRADCHPSLALAAQDARDPQPLLASAEE